MCDAATTLIVVLTCVPVLVGVAVEDLSHQSVRILNAIAYGSLAGVMVGQVGPAVLRVPTRPIQEVDVRVATFLGMALLFLLLTFLVEERDSVPEEEPARITVLPIAISMLADGLILGGTEGGTQSMQLFLSAVLSIDNIFEGFDLGNQVRRDHAHSAYSPYVLALILTLMIGAFIPAGVAAGHLLRRFRWNRLLSLATSFALASIVWSVLIDVSGAVQPIKTRGERAAVSVAFLIPVTGEWLVG